jgi:hypothetical protein
MSGKFCREPVRQKGVKLDDRRSQIASVRTADLSEQDAYSVLQDIFSMKERILPRPNWARKRIRKLRSLRPSEDEVADLACDGVGESSK